MKPIAILLAAASLATGAAAAQAGTVRSLVLTPGKGVSFFMGAKHGVTLFTPTSGGCDLTVALADKLDQEGMAQTSSSRIKMTVVAGKPARIETADGHALVFDCAADGQSMKLDMPEDFKFTSKG